MTQRAACRALALVGMAWLVSCAAPIPDEDVRLGEPLSGLDERQLGRFLLGKAVFERLATQEEGLGPLYNETRCSACHDAPVVGGAGFATLVTKATHWGEAGCDMLVAEGGDNIQQRATPLLAAHGVFREEIPSRATSQSSVTAPPLFGAGLVEAIPESAIRSRADPEDADGDGISGRPSVTEGGAIGRFGRKGDVATLAGFVDTALRFELGLTTPEHPVEERINGRPLPDGVDPLEEPEIDANGVQALAEFARYLAPPGRAPIPDSARDSVRRGEVLFERIGCAACHVPEARTARDAEAPLADRSVRMYSDLLLHDLGDALADVCAGRASPSEWLTARLWGLRFRSRLLHDGRAATVAEAVGFHGGEAERARDAFAALDASERALLLRFLATL